MRNEMEKQPVVSEELLLQFSQFISQQMGLSFSGGRLNELECGVRSALETFDRRDVESGIRWLMSGPMTREQIEILSVHLTVGETFFFREPHTFEILEKKLIPGIIHEPGNKGGCIRIWSAACSTGEEAYTIAIVLDRLGNILEDRSVSILATDINIHALQKAQAGIYGKWAFRGCPDWLIPTYFIPREKGKYEIKPEIKKKVRFSYLNLAEDNYPSLLNQTNAMDIIFCRNVLMYFLPGNAKIVVDRLYRSLLMDRWLVVSPTDAFNVQEAHCFNRTKESSSIFTKCHKLSKPAPSVQPPAPAPRSKALPGEKKPFPAPRPAVSTVSTTPRPGAYDRALAMFKQGDYPGALALLETVKPDQAGANIPAAGRAGIYTLLARCHANLGQLDKAGKWCEKAVQTDKLNPSVYYLQSTIFQEIGDHDAAVRALKKCLYLDHDFLLAHFTLGVLLFGRGEHNASRKHLESALSLLDEHPDADVVLPEEGLTAGRLREIVKSTLGR